MPNPSKARPAKTAFILAWLLLNAAGWGLGFSLQFLLVHSTGGGGLAALGGSLLASAVIGLAQWLGLRWLLPRLGRGSDAIAYVILTMFGFAAGLVFGSLISGLAVEDGSMLLQAAFTFLGWVVVGLVTGMMQWFLLRAAARGAAWWLGANALGYGLGTVLITSLPAAQNLGAWSYTVAGLVVGFATLVALSRLRKPSGEH